MVFVETATDNIDKVNYFCRSALLFFNPLSGLYPGSERSAVTERLEGIKYGGEGEKETKHTQRKRDRDYSSEGEEIERICAHTDYTCNSYKGSGIFITKKSLIKVSRDQP